MLYALFATGHILIECNKIYSKMEDPNLDQLGCCNCQLIAKLAVAISSLKLACLNVPSIKLPSCGLVWGWLHRSRMIYLTYFRQSKWHGSDLGLAMPYKSQFKILTRQSSRHRKSARSRGLHKLNSKLQILRWTNLVGWIKGTFYVSCTFNVG